MAFRAFPRRGQPQPVKQKHAFASDTEPVRRSTRQNALVKPLARPTKDNLKPAKTVSTAAVLKRKPMKEVYRTRIRHRRRETEHPLFLDYQGNCLVHIGSTTSLVFVSEAKFMLDDMEASRAQLESDAKASLEESHQELLNSLQATKARNNETVATAKLHMDAILAPLADMKITTKIITKSGSKTTKTVNIGEQVDDFRAQLAIAETELKQQWERWDEAQRELAELGVEVLGKDATGAEGVGKLVRGYAADKEVWDTELSEQFDLVEKEIEAAGKDAIEKLVAAEKVR